MSRSDALKHVENARSRLLQVSAILRGGYGCGAVLADSELAAIARLLADAKQEVFILCEDLDQPQGGTPCLTP